MRSEVGGMAASARWPVKLQAAQATAPSATSSVVIAALASAQGAPVRSSSSPSAVQRRAEDARDSAPREPGRRLLRLRAAEVCQRQVDAAVREHAPDVRLALAMAQEVDGRAA
jgi:hypothetical protein